LPRPPREGVLVGLAADDDLTKPPAKTTKSELVTSAVGGNATQKYPCRLAFVG